MKIRINKGNFKFVGGKKSFMILTIYIYDSITVDPSILLSFYHLFVLTVSDSEKKFRSGNVYFIRIKYCKALYSVAF